MATKGQPIPLGTASMPLVPAAADAPPAARLREAGAVIFSKTTMPDYGMLSSGLSSFHPLTRNPWDLSKNPGGSSAGGGAAGAAGYGPLHLGTDIGGSVRLPACWCGLVGLKPSLGRVPIDPPYVGRVAGPMTRTVDDAALMMSVLSRPDRRDGMSLPAVEINWKALDKSPRKLRIGLMLDPGVGQPLEKEVREVAVKAAKAFEFAAPINDPEKPFEHIAYTVPWNMSENPAVSVNGGYDKKGFPIGVQIVGRRFDDLGVLGMAKAFEGLRGPQKPWPAPPKK